MPEVLRPARSVPDFLRGGGDMGERIRAFAWEATALGPPDTWSLQARTAARILLSTNHPVFLFLGPELVCLYNDAYARSLGPEYHPAMLGSRGREAWAEIWPIIGPQIDYVMSGQGSTWHENQLVPITRHGQREDVYWTYGYSPIDDPAAERGVGGVLVLCTETTEQVLASERRRAAEQRWRQLFDQAPGFMCVLRGPRHAFEFANPAYFSVVHRDDGIIGTTVAEALPWAQEQGFVAILDEVFASGEPFLAREAAFVLPDEHGRPQPVRYLDFVYQPIRDEHGRVDGIFVLGSDVSERKHAEEALRHSEEQLRMARDAADLGIHDYNIETGDLVWDQRVRAIWGLEPDDPVDVDIFLQGVHPDDRAATLAQVERATDAAGDGRYFAEYRVVHRQDASVRWVQATGRVSFREGRPVRLVGTLIDISERKHADARRHEFLATLGHELRNPLAPIANSLHLLKRQAEGDSSVRQAHDIIDRQLRHMVRLLEDLLDVVRVTNGRIELRRETVAVQDIVRLAMETALPHVQRGTHEVNVQAPAEPVYLLADAVRLAQVFSNLLINACKYSDPGSRIEVITEAPRQGQVVVRFRDRGVGLSAQQLARVFEMFSQAEPSLHRSQGGLGIGLSLAKGLAELHGGSIEGHSAGLQQGSEFIVRLPVVAAPRIDDTPGQVARLPAGQLRGRRLMVVDDNRDAALSLAQLLAGDGAITELADDGVRALALADAFRPQAVLLDIGLPGMNGYEVCRHLRARPWGKDVVIIALTGWGQQADRAMSRESGFDHHLVKPVDYEELLRLLPAAD